MNFPDVVWDITRTVEELLRIAQEILFVLELRRTQLDIKFYAFRRYYFTRFRTSGVLSCVSG
jgi:hypothetical protein